MSDAPVLIAKDDLHAFAKAILVADGVDAATADSWVRVLVWANLRGVDSHGVIRIPRYLDLLSKGSVNRRPDMRIERRSGAIAVLEADRAPGPVAMERAMAEAIDRAREVHIGWCAARNITHAGAVGYYALQAAEAGMAGIVMTASIPLMAYHGARVAGLSSNPLAIAVPAGNRPPYLLDMSTSNVAMGKLLNARDKKTPIPTGWGIDVQGRDTNDPTKVATLLPVGGAKGSGLSFMIECLASLALSNPLIAPALAAGSGTENPILNGVAVAIDLAAFGMLDEFRRNADALGDAISGLPPAEGVDRVFLPGERGDAILQQRSMNGIPIPQGTWSRIVKEADARGVSRPNLDR